MSGGWGWDDTQLLHHPEFVLDEPSLDDFVIGHPLDRYALDSYLPIGRRQTLKLARMHPSPDETCRYQGTFGDLFARIPIFMSLKAPLRRTIPWRWVSRSSSPI